MTASKLCRVGGGMESCMKIIVIRSSPFISAFLKRIFGVGKK